MSSESILSLIDQEIVRLTKVRALLASAGKVGDKIVLPKAAKQAKQPVKTKKKRILSPEARKRIADAQKRRWAAQKAKA